MTSFVYNPAKLSISPADLLAAADNLRTVLIMTDTTADTDRGAAALDEIGTLDEYDGVGYARQPLVSVSAVVNPTANSADLDADDVTFATLAAGTRQAAGAMLVIDTGDPSTSVPFAFTDEGGFPFAGTGKDVTIQWGEVLSRFRDAD